VRASTPLLKGFGLLTKRPSQQEVAIACAGMFPAEQALTATAGIASVPFCPICAAGTSAVCVVCTAIPVAVENVVPAATVTGMWLLFSKRSEPLACVPAIERVPVACVVSLPVAELCMTRSGMKRVERSDVFTDGEAVRI